MCRDLSTLIDVIDVPDTGVCVSVCVWGGGGGGVERGVV